MNKHNKPSHNKKYYDKKIYFKDLGIHNLKPNIINYLKKKNIHKTKNNHFILSNKGIYILKNQTLKKYNYISTILNETNYLIELNHFLKFEQNCTQIPFEHHYLNIQEISFNINDYILTFEIIDKNINDFYIKSTNSLNILDILMIKEISYIKNLLI